jgi:hypothetical protein
MALGLMVWTLAGIPGAAADPVQNPGVAIITQTCNGVDYQFAVKHAGGSDNIPGSAHVIGSSGVGILKTTDVEVYVDEVLVDSFHLEWHKIGNGISEDRIVTCTNVIPPGDGVVIYAHNTLVFPPGWPE